jgi:hypothetical protein
MWPRARENHGGTTWPAIIPRLPGQWEVSPVVALPMSRYNCAISPEPPSAIEFHGPLHTNNLEDDHADGLNASYSQIDPHSGRRAI